VKLSLQDRVALIYSGAGSQREVARRLGISHQRVGRLLKAGSPELGGYALNSRALLNPDLLARVESAFDAHKREAKAQARRDGIPYSADVPIFARNVAHSDGSPGGRVAAEHTHWIRDELRNLWIKKAHATRKYANVSVQSVVSLYDYIKQGKQRAAQDRAAGNPPPGEAIGHAIGLQMNFNAGRRLQTIGTSYTSLQFPDYALPLVFADIDEKLRRKHAPATGDDRPGTKLATRIVLQIDSRANRDTSKPQKAGRNRAGSKRRR
jgi:hypothetical protein